MNSLLSDESLNDSGHSIATSNDKSKGITVLYGKSGRLITLPPVETPKTRSLVKKEVSKHQFFCRKYSSNKFSVLCVFYSMLKLLKKMTKDKGKFQKRK